VFLTAELFREADVVSDRGRIYVFPIDNMPNTMFVHNVKEDGWSQWYAVIGQEVVFKMVLDPRGPYAKFGHVHEPWGAVVERPPAIRLLPSAFPILQVKKLHSLLDRGTGQSGLEPPSKFFTTSPPMSLSSGNVYNLRWTNVHVLKTL